MRFVLFVEGETERLVVPGFLKRYLDPRLSGPVRVAAVKFDGASAYLKGAQRKCRAYANAPDAGDLIAVVGLLDLHRVPLDFPRKRDPAEARCRWAKAEIERAVGHPAFRQFFAVHEVESWLLSQPSLFDGGIARTVEKEAREPERVNDRTPPAAFLDALYEKETGRGYKKTTYGAALFPRLDPALAAAKCPHLKQMLDEMVRLAGERGGA